MYADFLIDDNGDLVIQECIKEVKSQKVSFYFSKYKSQKINFFIQNETHDNVKNNSTLKLSFEVNKKNNEIKAIVCKKLDADAQLLRIQLNTVLNELPYRKEEGSKICLFRHMNIDNQNLQLLKTYLTSFLQDYLINPSIKITPIIPDIFSISDTILWTIYYDV